MQDLSLSDLGGPFGNALPPEDPETQLDAKQYNLAALTVAQASRTAYRAIVEFITSATATVLPGADAVSVWGNATAQQPTIQRTASGVYLVTYPTSFVNELEETEEVLFRFGHASIANPGFALVNSLLGNVITVQVFDTTWTLSDLGGGVPVILWLR